MNTITEKVILRALAKYMEPDTGVVVYAENKRYIVMCQRNEMTKTLRVVDMNDMDPEYDRHREGDIINFEPEKRVLH